MRAAGWRLAGRIAHRDVRRNRGRSLLIVAMLALPVVGLVAADVVIRTSNLTPAEQATRLLGTADLDAVRVSDGAIDQVEAPYLDYTGEGPLPPSPDVDPALLPPGSTSTEIVEGQAAFATPSGVRPATVLLMDAGSPLTDGLVRVREGRLPAADDEVALSPSLADRTQTPIGERVALGAGTASFLVVGLAVFPDAIGIDSAVAAPGALPLDDSGYPRLLVDLPDGTDLLATARELNVAGVAVTPRSWILDPAPQPVNAQDRALTIGLTVVTVGLALLQVILLAGAAFAVGARRQRRALGLLAATGADGRDVGRTILAQGALLGLVAGAAGVALGLLIALPLGAGVERLTGSLFGGWQIRWFELLAIAGLGLASGLLSALLPARTAARQDPLRALLQRPDPPRSGRRLTAAGLVIAAGGLGITLFGTSMAETNYYVILGGAVLVELGFVLCAPALVGLAGMAAGPLPVPLRMALRDAARHRARSGPAVAAVMAALAGCTAVSIFFVSQDAYAEQTYQPRVGIGQVVLDPFDPEAPTDPLPTELLSRIEAVLPGSTVASSQQLGPACAVDGCSYGLAFQSPPGPDSYPSIALADVDFLRTAVGGTDVAAERALAEGLVVVLGDGIARQETETLETLETIVYDDRGNIEDTMTHDVRTVQVPARPGYAYDVALLSPQTAAEVGLVSISSPSYVLTPPAGVTSAEEDRLAELATDGDFSFQVERGYESPAGPILLSLLGASVVVVLGATGISTALAAAEGRADLATLAAVGAAPRTRRLLAMSQAAVVALLGAALGALAGFVPAAALVSTLVDWPLTIPWSVIAAMLVVVPVLAAGFAGLFTRSRLPMIRRTA